MLKLYNTLSRTVEPFRPLNPPHVGLYTCGPTVYWSTHIGHMSKYVRDDILKRVLRANGYAVTHVMNITDVGHLSSDADEGEDKMEKGARREGLSVWDTARKYEGEFFDTMDALGVIRPDVVCRATEHIAEQIALIQRLEERGYTYETELAVYFDVAKFPAYTKLSRQELSEKKIAARDDVVVDSGKRHPYDFALWFKRVGRFRDHAMHWDSPWGDGFPGWHIECSAMSMRYLGESFDIHTGGEDHIGVHHPAEIAQSEAATGKPFVRYWVHYAFITVDGRKMSKSLENFYTLPEITAKGYEPLALRYLFLTSHYRQPMDFTFESLAGAQEALLRLRERARELPEQGADAHRVSELRTAFLAAVNNDLQTPEALAVLWNTLRDTSLDSATRGAALRAFDAVFGLQIFDAPSEAVPDTVRALAEERKRLKAEGKYAEADRLRAEIRAQGYAIEDETGGGYRLKKYRGPTQVL